MPGTDLLISGVLKENTALQTVILGWGQVLW